MTSKKRPAKKNAQRKKAGQFSLVLIDGRPIRDAALKKYRQVEKQLGTLRTQIDSFESGDLPAYLRWEANAFGPILSALRSTLQTLEEKRQLFAEIEEEMFWSGCGQVAAYRRVMQAAEMPEQEMHESDPADERDGFEPAEERGNRMFGESDLPPDFDIEEYDRGTSRQKKEFQEFYATMANLYESMTGIRRPDLEEVLDRARRGDEGESAEETRQGYGGKAEQQRRGANRNETSDAVRQKTSRIKELYRRLVRQLHPDINRSQTARERELWHQVQEAYRLGDLALMEAAAGRLEIGLNGKSMTLPVHILQRMIRELHVSLKGLQTHVATLRKHPGWGFRARHVELEQMEAKRRAILQRDSQKARNELARLSAYLDDLKMRAEKQPARRRQTRSARNRYDQEIFPF